MLGSWIGVGFLTLEFLCPWGYLIFFSRPFFKFW
nr:MAG TPA: hypothetical protein [Caudoviricetes sp.]